MLGCEVSYIPLGTVEPTDPPTTKRGNDAPKEAFSMAFQESFGFFDDITNDDWERRKELARRTQHLAKPNSEHKDLGQGKHVSRWLNENWHPYFSCPSETMIGQIGDGHKYVCNVHRLAKLEDCLVYSVGSDGDFSFEDALLKLAPNCEVHTFDFGNYAETLRTKWPNTTTTLHQWGMVGKVENKTDKVKTLEETIRLLGHEDRRIDILKVDCEFCEWAAYQDWLDVPNDITQILVETHTVKTKFFQDMWDAGYVIFHKEPNLLWNAGCEWSYLKLAKSFSHA